MNAAERSDRTLPVVAAVPGTREIGNGGYSRGLRRTLVCVAAFSAILP
jgi:hypothetical protein